VEVDPVAMTAAKMISSSKCLVMLVGRTATPTPHIQRHRSTEVCGMTFAPKKHTNQTPFHLSFGIRLDV